MEDLREESEKQAQNFSSDDALFGISDKGTEDNIATEKDSGKSEQTHRNVANTNHQTEKHKGSRELIDKYNINDQAHSNSSKDDFVKTISNYNHADGSDNSKD